MRELLQKLAANQQPVAFCRLVATRGSTPQKAGAAMLVYSNGQQFGTLGGGCVEAEVKRRAIATLNGGHPTVMSFQLDHDYGWDDGLICGGRMDVMVWPLRDNDAASNQAARQYFSQLSQAYESGSGGVESISFETNEDSTTPSDNAEPRCFLFDLDRKLVASLPKSSAPDADSDSKLAQVTQAVAQLGSHGRPQVIDGIVCLPIEVRHRLVIVGGGHVGQAVAELASQLSFDVCIVDDRAECITSDRFPLVPESDRICGQLAEVLPAVAVDSQTFCLIVTRGHNHDQEALFHLVNRGARYVGMIGSRRKVNLIFENLAAEGVSQSALDAVHAPVGIEIGSQSVPEIAVSIAAQLIAVRRGQRA